MFEIVVILFCENSDQRVSINEFLVCLFDGLATKDINVIINIHVKMVS